MEAKVKDLELKIKTLEDQLKNVSTAAGQQQIDPEELRVFKKVGSQLGFDFDTSCGINECRVVSICVVCRVCRVCRICSVCSVCNVCINECSCGPCIAGTPTVGNIDRFGGMGF